ncbi:signal transduction histidine kinase [Phaeobacter piscinae]|uniref:histidine kinase n=1 Tax=Phaeobacter piscinae TaxID=1580596 RepID=A0AAN1GS60_9RHOB|nr:ATP-binding protein [Phaeobacter piscinae]ATG44233.1 signal transduction histidine kinase [Phaeobacter piscinae]AUR36543.1 signal transduction histidine kinase [Phaeobacter piscinae]
MSLMRNRVWGRSVRQRIQWLVIPLLAIAIVVASTTLFVSARLKVSNLLQEQTDILAIATTTMAGDQIGPRSEEMIRKSIEAYKGKFVIRIRDAAGRTTFNSKPDLPPFSRQEIGESMIISHGGIWLVRRYNLSSGGELVIGRPREESDKIVWQVVLSALIPLLLVFAASVAAILYAVRIGLMPLSDLSNELGHRTADRLDTLNTAGRGEELVPIVTSLNGLFDRIQEAMRREREFIDDAAHEIRTPLAAIKAQIQVIDRSTLDGDAQKRFDNILLGVDRAASMADSLLDQAKADQDRAPQSLVKVASVLRRSIADLLPVAERKGIKLELSKTDGSVFHCAQQDLQTIMGNILSNAIKYCAQGAQIQVSLSSGRIAVEDSGPGIPEDMRDKIFERFVRLECNAVHGAGLGLSVVQSLANANSLKVAVVDAVALQGARFEIWQPETDAV